MGRSDDVELERGTVGNDEDVVDATPDAPELYDRRWWALVVLCLSLLIVFIECGLLFPILPGETRDITLVPEGDEAGAPAPAIAYPVQLKGRLDWGSQQLDVDAAFAR
mgnify:CR=1 FL=1